MTKHEITRADIMAMEEYGKIRKQRRAQVTEMKRDRRMACGPDATFYFENYDTMWHQIHEMLYIERGGEDQIADELAAYNPLIPKGTELVATFMFEIDDPDRRARVLGSLGGVEETVSIEVDGETIKGKPEEDTDRTNAAGKASSVQFVHFPFTPSAVEKFKKPNARVILCIGHPNYGHMAIMPESVRAALAKDFS